MKRDKKLIRKILERVKEAKVTDTIEAKQFEGYEEQYVADHLFMIWREGLISEVRRNSTSKAYMLEPKLSDKGQEYLKNAVIRFAKEHNKSIIAIAGLAASMAGVILACIK